MACFPRTLWFSESKNYFNARGVTMTSNDVMDVAMEWHMIMRSSTQAELRRAEFDAWWRQDPSHRFAYKQASCYWDRLENAAALLRQGGPSTPEALLSEIAEVAERTRQSRAVTARVQWWALRVACVLAVGVLVLVGRYVLGAREVPLAWMPYDGSQTHYILSDGSELYLNGKNAAARVRMGRHAREIALDQGEILINVRRGDTRPLLVEIDDWVVRATGTQFAVRRDPTGVVRITVQEGSVRIIPVRSFRLSSLLRQAGIAHAGQAAVISGGTVQVADRDPLEDRKSVV